MLGRAQGPIAPPPASVESVLEYEDSSEGLRLQLQDILAAAKDHNRAKLGSLTKQTEIPNDEEWFTKTFGQEKAKSWADPYGRELLQNQAEFEELFQQIAAADGELFTRRVNDNPGPPGSMEAGMIVGQNGPVEFFFASWRKQGAPPDSKGDPIGYFVFLDRRFRWNSSVNVINLSSLPSPSETIGPFHPGVGGVTFPTCSFCPDPTYTREARAKHIEGTVVLRVIITPDGRATDIVVVRAVDQGLAEKAVEAVSKWRFKPARGEDRQPVPVIVPIEVTFRLLN